MSIAKASYVRCIAACALPLASASGQCTTVAVPVTAVAGVAAPGPSAAESEIVNAATMWDPDGPGPETPKLVLAGSFEVAGTAASPDIAAWDPATGLWSAIGPTDFGAGGTPLSVVGLANGDLIVGGYFQTVNGLPIQGVARWNGSSWSPLGAGLNHAVNVLLAMPNGDILAGGAFTASGGLAVAKIARWNGSSWSPLGSGLSSSPSSVYGEVASLVLLPNGDVVAGGSFDVAGGVAAANVARWNGTAWSALGAGLATPYQRVSSLALATNGDLFAGGTFTTGAGNRLSRWDGATWSPLGSGISNQGYCEAHSLLVAANGSVFVGGRFSSAGGQPANHVASWNGSAWAAMGNGMTSLVYDIAVRALVPLPNGEIVAVGRFQAAGNLPVLGAARWDGSSWGPLTTGINNRVTACTTTANGDLVVGGLFRGIGDTTAERIALRIGSTWVPLGPGLNGPPRAIVRLPNGDLVAAGSFSLPGTPAAVGMARWDGATWSALGSGMGPGGIPYALAVLPNGDLVMGGDFTSVSGVAAANIAVWNGTVWSPIGSGTAGAVQALAVLTNGDLVASGSFAAAGGVAANRIARWNGSSWSAMGSGPAAFYIPQISALLPGRNGSLIAGGRFQSMNGIPANCIAQWNGSSWSALGGGVSPPSGSSASDVLALALLPNGDVVAGGEFGSAGSVPARNLARWNGSSWSAFGTGCDAEVSAMTTLPNGDLVIGGSFLTVDSQVSGFVAEITTTCPATATPFGSGCTGSAGQNTLAALTLPWLGSTCQTELAGAPANSLTIGAFGLGWTALSLASLLPQGGAGCQLSVTPDVLVTSVPSGGTTMLHLPIPNTSALVGAIVYEQGLVAELGSNGLLALTSSNALTLTVGSF